MKLRKGQKLLRLRMVRILELQKHVFGNSAAEIFGVLV